VQSCANTFGCKTLSSPVVEHSSFNPIDLPADLMLRRHDYNVNIAGGFKASQLISDYVVANGIRLPTKRRRFPTLASRFEDFL
jgi:hypothetical protein